MIIRRSIHENPRIWQRSIFQNIQKQTSDTVAMEAGTMSVSSTTMTVTMGDDSEIPVTHWMFHHPSFWFHQRWFKRSQQGNHHFLCPPTPPWVKGQSVCPIKGPCPRKSSLPEVCFLPVLGKLGPTVCPEKERCIAHPPSHECVLCHNPFQPEMERRKKIPWRVSHVTSWQAY